MKPGYKSTEFWLYTLAILLTFISSSGLIEASSDTAKVLGVAIATLLALGYGKQRFDLKAKELAEKEKQIDKILTDGVKPSP